MITFVFGVIVGWTLIPQPESIGGSLRALWNKIKPKG
jgi:hypothetical protein